MAKNEPTALNTRVILLNKVINVLPGRTKVTKRKNFHIKLINRHAGYLRIQLKRGLIYAHARKNIKFLDNFTQNIDVNKYYRIH